jgi:hypothetical protein
VILTTTAGCSHTNPENPSTIVVHEKQTCSFVFLASNGQKVSVEAPVYNSEGAVGVQKIAASE